jgi:tetratricopeptide (TPR) repeat protein
MPDPQPPASAPGPDPVPRDPGATLPESPAAGAREHTLRDATATGLPLDAAATVSTAHADRTLADGPQPVASTLALNATSLASGAGAPAPRFIVSGTLGQGATSAVLLAHDRDFDRDVAIKYLAPVGGAPAAGPLRFLREARVTARLEHPNIVPVHDLGQSADGGLYMVMRRLSGRSLGDRIRAALADGRGEVEPPSTIVTLFLKLCDALAYAHSKGVLHRDIKPDNIMLGEFGEVVLVDWGTATDHGEDGSGGVKSLVGTPAYMSPEQARGEPIGPAGDVYCLGASLFHALILRHPLHPTDRHEDYWRKKCAGEFDPPTAVESARVPRQLLAIVLKAMAPTTAGRYAQVKDFAADLHKWQSGLAVSAYKDPWTVRLRRWHRRHAWLLWPTAAVLLVVAATALYLYGQGLKEFADWGRPLADEDFHDDGWTTRWAPTVPGAFSLADGHLVSMNERGSVMFFKQRLTGSVELDYDARFPTGSRPGDISAVWTEGNLFATAQPGVDNNARTLWIQAGAFDNIAAMILTMPSQKRESYRRLVLAPDVWHHVRVTIAGTHVEQQVDGETTGAYDAIFPFTSGYVGLYAYFPGKQYAHVRIYNRGVAQKVSVLEIGDSFYQAGLYDQAATHYQRVVDSQPGSDVAEAAMYRLGLCRLVQNRWDDANTWWSRVRDPDLRLQIQIHQLDHLDATGQMDTLATAFMPLYDNHPELRAVLRNHWRDWVGARETRMPETVQPLVAIQERKFPDEADTNDIAWTALARLGRWDDALKDYPHDPGVEAMALMMLGRTDEMLAKYGDNPIHRCAALVERGDYDQALPQAPAYDWLYRPLLLSTGRDDRYAAEFGRDVRYLLMRGQVAEGVALPNSDGDLLPFRCAALLVLGRGDDALAATDALIPRYRNDCRVRLLVWLGRTGEALDQAQEWEARNCARTAHLIEVANAGDLVQLHLEAKALAAEPWAPQWSHGWFAHEIALPFLDQLGKPDAPGGETGALMRSLQDMVANRRHEHHQQPWYFARLVLGQITPDEFNAQPYQPGITGTLLLGTALRHDLHGEVAPALADYQSWLDLPLWQRGVDGVEGLGDPVMERFVRFRLKGAVRPSSATTPATAPAP